MQDMATDDGRLDDVVQPHGTNVAGIILGERRAGLSALRFGAQG
jgi:hypothetical protein